MLGNLVNVDPADGSDPATLETLIETIKGEGGVAKLIAPKVGGGKMKGGAVLKADAQLAGAPSGLSRGPRVPCRGARAPSGASAADSSILGTSPRKARSGGERLWGQPEGTSVADVYAACDVVSGLDQIRDAMGEAVAAATTRRNDLGLRARLCVDEIALDHAAWSRANSRQCSR